MMMEQEKSSCFCFLEYGLVEDCTTFASFGLDDQSAAEHSVWDGFSTVDIRFAWFIDNALEIETKFGEER